MNRPGAVVLIVALLALNGCFDNSGNETKNNTDGTKSSVQMQEGKSDQNK